MNENQLGVLERARQTYGNKNQILVCIEELNELACVLAKFPRYDSEEEAREKLRDKTLDEVADVEIILNHVKAIIGLTEDEVCEHTEKKVARLKRWLDTSSSMEQTTIDRGIEAYSYDTVHDCWECTHFKECDYNLCNTCHSTEAVEGVKPFYKKG